jgi:hypothetical protein
MDPRNLLDAHCESTLDRVLLVDEKPEMGESRDYNAGQNCSGVRVSGSAVDRVVLGWRMFSVVCAGGGVIVRHGARGIGSSRDIPAVSAVHSHISANATS